MWWEIIEFILKLQRRTVRDAAEKLNRVYKRRIIGVFYSREANSLYTREAICFLFNLFAI